MRLSSQPTGCVTGGHLVAAVAHERNCKWMEEGFQQAAGACFRDAF